VLAVFTMSARMALAHRVQPHCPPPQARLAPARRLRARCAGAAQPPAATWHIRPAVPGNAEEIERILAECGSRRVRCASLRERG
jgi:hypothetical protein